MKKNSAEFAILDCVEVPKTKIFRGCDPGPPGGRGDLQHPQTPRPPAALAKAPRAFATRSCGPGPYGPKLTLLAILDFGAPSAFTVPSDRFQILSQHASGSL